MFSEVKSSQVYNKLKDSQETYDPCECSASSLSDQSEDSFGATGSNAYSLVNSQDKEASPFLCINTSSSSVTSLECSPIQNQKETFEFAESTSSRFNAQSEFLDFIDPIPACPPHYNDMPPGGCPKFPVFDMDCDNEILPSYSPAAYKVGVCSRKQEWLSPYEVSPSRSWKNVIIELNSTQLNVYSIPSQLDATLMSIRSNEKNEGRPARSISDTHLNSVVTTELDMEVRRVCNKLNLFDLGSSSAMEYLAHSQPSNGSHSLALAHKTLKVCKLKKLLRSYSLQYARIGLANDYAKKPNVLRLRLENEQFLLCFKTTKELIEWNLALSIGKDVSLDLTEREIPKYRTVPRRRSTHTARSSPFFNEVVSRRLRSRSEPLLDSSSSTSLRDKFSKLKTKIVTPAALNSSKAIKASHEQRELRKPPSTTSIATNQTSDRYRQRSPSVLIATNFTLSSDDEFANDDMEATNARDYEEETDGEAQNMSDIRGSDEDEDLETDFEDFLNLRFSEEPSNVEDIEDQKWVPVVKLESRRRYLRNCVKCIRPLGFDDNWIHKLLVKPTTMTPLTTAYVRNNYTVRDSSYSSLSDMGEDTTSSPGISSIRRKSAGKESFYSLPDTSLARIPHHNLKEYSVGPHSLIPKVL